MNKIVVATLRMIAVPFGLIFMAFYKLGFNIKEMKKIKRNDF